MLEAPVDRLVRTVNPGYLPPAVPAALMDAPLPPPRPKQSRLSRRPRPNHPPPNKSKSRGQIDRLACHPSAIGDDFSVSSRGDARLLRAGDSAHGFFPHARPKRLERDHRHARRCLQRRCPWHHLEESQGQRYSAFDNSIVIDPFFIFFGFLFLAATALVDPALRPLYGARARTARRILRADASRQRRHDVPGLRQRPRSCSFSRSKPWRSASTFSPASFAANTAPTKPP